jgi:hypothetical protein
MLPRRDFLKFSALASLGALAGCATTPQAARIRPITRGPKFHWRGYYDKFLFSADDRFVLANEVDFEGRTPTKADSIRVGMVDTQDGDRWIDLGGSNAWNWQQGCMLQWVPGSDRDVAWNDREGGQFVTRVPCPILSIPSVRTVRRLSRLTSPAWTSPAPAMVTPRAPNAISGSSSRLPTTRASGAWTWPRVSSAFCSP